MVEGKDQANSDRLKDLSVTPEHEAVLNHAFAEELAAIARRLSPERSIRSLCVYRKGDEGARFHTLSTEEISLQEELGRRDTDEAAAFREWQTVMWGLTPIVRGALRKVLNTSSRSIEFDRKYGNGNESVSTKKSVPTLRELQEIDTTKLRAGRGMSEPKALFVKVVFGDTSVEQ